MPILFGRALLRILRALEGEQVQLIAGARQEGETVPVVYKPSDRAFAVRIEMSTCVGIGINPGDLVVVEPAGVLPLVNGCIIVALHEGRVGAWVYSQPNLVPQGVGDGRSILTFADVQLIGRAVQVERPLL